MQRGGKSRGGVGDKSRDVFHSSSMRKERKDSPQRNYIFKVVNGQECPALQPLLIRALLMWIVRTKRAIRDNRASFLSPPTRTKLPAMAGFESVVVDPQSFVASLNKLNGLFYAFIQMLYFYCNLTGYRSGFGTRRTL